MKQTEKQIENAILSYLATIPTIKVWKNQTVGIFDPVKKVYRKTSKHSLKGVADIIGHQIGSGRSIYIEVKSKTGRLSKEQKTFLTEAKEAGCIAFVARSLDDVISNLENY